ncbi:hypothetical protein F5Y13DRAFT_198567 [Hypoxylon sp. FL1857]|nr:hypothetical protein F5Y13DRAFT_198567 [Hypoxylon sp. FL1857]
MEKQFGADFYAESDFNSTCGGEGSFTPTGSSTMGNDSKHDPNEAVVAAMVWKYTVPWPGNIYIIRDPESHRQITLVDGELRLEPHLGNQGGYHWKCIEKAGYLGFRNPSDNLHIGHDNRGNFIAQKTHHKEWEYFNTRAHPDGGHLLLMAHSDGQRKMTIGPDGQRLVETNGAGTAWEFEKVLGGRQKGEELGCQPS